GGHPKLELLLFDQREEGIRGRPINDSCEGPRGTDQALDLQQRPIHEVFEGLEALELRRDLEDIAQAVTGSPERSDMAVGLKCRVHPDQELLRPFGLVMVA